MQGTRVVVAIGAAGEGRGVLEIAAALANRLDGGLELVSVIVDGSRVEDREAELHEIVDEEALTDAEVTVLEGFRIAAGLTDHVRERDGDALLCLETTRRNRADELLFGSTASETVQRSSFPLLLVGPHVERTEPTEGSVVVTVDGSRLSETIVPLARRWCEFTGQTPWVVSQLDPDGPIDADLENAGVHRVADELGEHAEWEVLHGRDAASGICDFADDRGAGLIAMATHGRTGLASLAAGSVAMKTVQKARCPVLVERPEELRAD